MSKRHSRIPYPRQRDTSISESADLRIRASRGGSTGSIGILPKRKEARGLRGTHAMRRSDSGDLWCHSLNSAGPNDDFLLPPCRDEEYFRYVRTGDVQHGRLVGHHRAVRYFASDERSNETRHHPSARSVVSSVRLQPLHTIKMLMSCSGSRYDLMRYSLMHYSGNYARVRTTTITRQPMRCDTH